MKRTLSLLVLAALFLSSCAPALPPASATEATIATRTEAASTPTEATASPTQAPLAIEAAVLALVPESYQSERSSVEMEARPESDYAKLVLENDFFRYPQECAYAAFFMMQTVLDSKEHLPEHNLRTYDFAFYAEGALVHTASYTLADTDNAPIRIADTQGSTTDYEIGGFARLRYSPLLVGTDIPAGEYVLYGDGSAFAIYQSAEATEPLHAEEGFRYRRLVTLQDGQKLTMTDANAILFAYETPISPQETAFVDGMYKVGTDFPAGTYTLHPVSSQGVQYAIYRDSLFTKDSLLTQGEAYEDESIELAEGTYVQVANGSLRVPEQGGHDDAP